MAPLQVLLSLWFVVLAPAVLATHNNTGLVSNINQTVSNDAKSNEPQAGSSRTPRKLFKKLHSGVAFLTGYKLGTLVSKHLEATQLGHGSVASSHSFKLFGKSVNSALSFSYGDFSPHLPAVTEFHDDPKTDPDADNIVHVTVIENPSPETLDQLKRIASVRENEIPDDNKEKEDKKVNFFEEHNKRVEQLNEQIKRRANSKF